MLRVRIIGIIFFCIATLISALYVISNTTLISSYEEIEADQMHENLQRIDHAIQNYRNSLNIKLRDWAQWDDSYNFVQGFDEEYEESNLGDSTLVNLEITYMAFENASGTMVFSKAIDQESQEAIPSDRVTEALLHSSLNKGTEEKVSDLLSVDGELFFIEGLPIIQSNGEGYPMGTVYFGRVIDQSFIAYVGELTRLPVELVFKTANKTHTIALKNKDTITGYTPLMDQNGKVLATLGVAYNRTIYQQGEMSIRTYSFISSSVILLFGLFMLLVFEMLLLSRLAKLSSDIDAISVTNLAKVRLKEEKHDELGKLAQTINHLLEELAISQKNEHASARAELRANEQMMKSIKTTENMNKLMVGREIKMRELKERISALEAELKRNR